MTEEKKESKKTKQGETEEITKKYTDQESKEFKASGVEGTKDATPPSEVVRGEDVVKRLREKGYKI